MSVTAVTVKGVSFRYGTAVVLDNVSFTIKQGDFIAILGPNGSGKTTLAKLLLGVLTPEHGTVRIFGGTERSIGYVPQKIGIEKNYPGTVSEILQMRPGNAQEICTQLGIDYQEEKFSSLSGGQQQRVLIALALIMKPKILILDEPESGIDVSGQDKFYRILKQLNREGVTIILVTHDLGVVSKQVKSVLCINRTVCYQGPAKNTGPILKGLYGGAFQHVGHHH